MVLEQRGQDSSWFLPSFTEFLPSFSWVRRRFQRERRDWEVLPSFTGFLDEKNWFSPEWQRSESTLPSFTEFLSRFEIRLCPFWWFLKCFTEFFYSVFFFIDSTLGGVSKKR